MIVLMCFVLYLRNSRRQRGRRYVHVDFLLFIVTVEDLNLQRRYRYEDINILGTSYFAALDSTLGTR